MTAPDKFTPRTHTAAVKHNAARALSVLARNQAIADAAMQGLTAAREAASARATATARQGGGSGEPTQGP